MKQIFVPTNKICYLVAALLNDLATTLYFNKGKGGSERKRDKKREKERKRRIGGEGNKKKAFFTH